MAERISNDFWLTARRRGPSLYPWAEWLDGTTWRLVRGNDFSCSLKSFQSATYHAAQVRGLRVRTSVDHEQRIVTIQADVSPPAVLVVPRDLTDDDVELLRERFSRQSGHRIQIIEPS